MPNTCKHSQVGLWFCRHYSIETLGWSIPPSSASLISSSKHRNCHQSTAASPRILYCDTPRISTNETNFFWIFLSFHFLSSTVNNSFTSCIPPLPRGWDETTTEDGVSEVPLVRMFLPCWKLMAEFWEKKQKETGLSYNIGVSINGYQLGKNGWLISWKIPLKWMMTAGPPMT